MERSPRVAVVGVGSIGSMVLWRLAARGVPAVGFEQFSPGHDRSAAGGESRIFRSVNGDPAHVPLLAHARRLWQELEADSGYPLLALHGALAIGPPSSTKIGDMRATARDHNLALEELSRDAMAQRFPQHVLESDEMGLFDPAGGFLRPELAVLAAATRARELGAEIRDYQRVTGIEPAGSGVLVRTDDGADRFDRVVVTTGPWASQLLPDLPTRIEVRRPVQVWFAARDRTKFAPTAFPIFSRYGAMPCYGVPSADGLGVKLGLGTRANASVPDPDHLDRSVATADLEEHRETVSRVLPDVHPDPYRVSAYMEGYTEDGAALVGALPDLPSVVILVGFSGTGFKIASAMGDIGADLALTGESAALPEKMRVERRRTVEHL